MANVYNHSIRDAEYVARVRRHSPSSLIPLVAQAAAQYWRKDSWFESPFRKYTPWALADIARVSLVMGSEHRSVATPDDLLQCAAAYVSVNDPELAADRPDSVTNFMLRITAEQVTSFQQNPYNEVGRTAALFENTTPSRPLEVIATGWDTTLFGCTLSEYVGAGFFVQAAAANNGGRFSASWYDKPELAAVTDVLPPQLMAQIVDRNLVASAASFKNFRREKVSGGYRRFAYNPLLSKPVVSGILDDLIVPVLGQVFRKISPLGVYYAGAELWGDAFTRDVGDLFEQYVGRQLQTIPNVQVYPEIVYGKDNRKSVDWIVVCDSTVILVEVKSARPTEAVRMGTENAGNDLNRMLGRACKQLNTTDEHIANQHAAFAHIPTDLPRVGLIVTMEPFALANAKPIRDLLDVSPNIPTTIGSSEDVERLVTLQGHDVGAFLSSLLSDPSTEGSRISAGLAEMDLSRNAILDQAWETYDWWPKGKFDTHSKL